MNSQGNIQVNPQPRMKTVSAELITQACSSLKTIQSTTSLFKEVAPPPSANATSLVFASTEEQVQQALKNNVYGLIILEKVLPNVEKFIDKNKALWTTTNIHFSMSEVLKLFNPKTFLTHGIHPTASIDASARLGKNVTVEPFAVIGKNVLIGDHAVIGAHSVLENDSVIGASSHLSPHVFIGYNCHVGNHCIIGPHCTLGADGFGYFTDKQNIHHKIPQLGIVVIEDNCEMGASCAIDRATLTETRLKRGSKLDNFVHIAHNCEIGENAMLVAGFITAGSNKIGKNLTAAGGVQVGGHLTIADNVILTGRAGVTSSIDKPGIYGGFPLTEHRENLRILMSLASLPKMRKQISQVLKHLGLNEEK